MTTLLMLMAFSPSALKAENVSNPVPVESPEMNALKNRINEIKALDKSTLSKAEKKELRTELKSINQQLRSNNNGIYLSVGAIIIVILLLILLL
jgi:hypothetical protein